MDLVGGNFSFFGIFYLSNSMWADGSLHLYWLPSYNSTIHCIVKKLNTLVLCPFLTKPIVFLNGIIVIPICFYALVLLFFYRTIIVRLWKITFQLRLISCGSIGIYIFVQYPLALCYFNALGNISKCNLSCIIIFFLKKEKHIN